MTSPALRTLREHALKGQSEQGLHADWEFARLPSGAVQDPSDLARADAEWQAAIVPGTVAQALNGQADDIDAYDVWYRCRFRAVDERSSRRILCLEGLATLADVWLNGRLILESESMFEAHALDVSDQLFLDNELCIRFRALLPVLRVRRPRGRWPTPMVQEKNLRFVRTTLLGYMQGRFPLLRPVGPWRGVRLLSQKQLAIEQVQLTPRIVGTRGVLSVVVHCKVIAGAFPASAEVRLDEARALLRCERHDEASLVLSGEVFTENVRPWWPHTHGAPDLYPVEIDIEADGQHTFFDLGKVGFRNLELLRGGGEEFAFVINGQRIFCRGACLAPLDMASLHVSEDAYRALLMQAREAGMSMLRVGGTMVYESDHFYRLCDELGILVWQDFMFASMDYPLEDVAFCERIHLEASQFLERVTGRACIAMLCGNSEVAQHAAMMGMPRDHWSNAFFDEQLPALCARLCPTTAYLPSTPSGGALPFHAGFGPTHYYGVGNYLRPLEDARISRVRFAAECLAFSNVPDDASLLGTLRGEGTPHEPGSAHSFSEVTDHYVATLFDVDPRSLQKQDPPRYLALCRAATAHIMERVQGFWRSLRSGCDGALVFLLRDLVPGAGWGVIDSAGIPKSSYYGLKRAWAPLGLWFVDQGMDGVTLHIANDREQAVGARLMLALYRPDGKRIEFAQIDLELRGHSQQVHNVEGLLGHFVDASYAYRFGPPQHNLVYARLVDRSIGATLSQAFHLPLGLAHTVGAEPPLQVHVEAATDGSYGVEVTAQRLAISVAIEAPGFSPSDNYFHLAPFEPHHIHLRPLRDTGPLRASLKPLNSASATVLSFP